MKAALVIMAAGLGSRYGGNKQVDGVGPQGEMLMEYSIYDAVRAGFTKVVFIIKPDMRELMDRLWGDRTLITKTGEPLEVCYAMQDFTSIPDYYTIPAGRTKPFGTAHAVLCARPYLSEPFCVINADDYYGVDAYRAMYEELQRLPRQGRATMVGYLLKNTVSANGTVSRGVCRVEDGWLRGIHETLKIQLFPDGSIADVAGGPAPGAGAGHGGVHELLGLHALHLSGAGGLLRPLPALRGRGQHQGGVPAAGHGGRPARAGTAGGIRAALGRPLVRHDVPRGPAGGGGGAAEAPRRRCVSTQPAGLRGETDT